MGSAFIWGWSGERDLVCPTHVSTVQPVSGLANGGWGTVGLLTARGDLLLVRDGGVAGDAGCGAIVAAASLGWDNVVALKNTGNIVESEQLLTTWRPVSGLHSITRIACGDRHTLALGDGGLLFSWGDNSCAQLGLGGPSIISSPAPLYDAILTEDPNFPTAAGAASDAAAGKQPHLAQCSTPQRVRAMPGPARDVAAGGRHSLALLCDGGVAAWGWNLYGQCGEAPSGCLISSPARVRSLDALAQCAGPCAGVAAGLAHTAVLTQRGDVYSFGWGEFGQLGGGKLDPTSGGGGGGADFCGCGGGGGSGWGGGGGDGGGGGGGGIGGPSPVLLEHPALEEPDACVVSVSCGSRHSAAQLRDGRVLSWGWNGHGQLGLGDKRDRGEAVLVPLPEGGRAVALACGAWHTTVLVADVPLA